MKKHLLRKSFTTITLLVLPILLFAQGLPCDPDEPDPSSPFYCNPEDAPIDNWVFLLVFLVLALTIWYYYKQKKSLRAL